MNIEIRKSFEKDALKLPASIQVQLERVIGKMAATNTLSELPSCKKLKGFKNAYRIRIGGYRAGFFFENQTIQLVRVLDRKDVYKYFP